MNRRDFLKHTSGATAATLIAPSLISCNMKTNTPLSIHKVNSNFEREPLLRPFGFKGSAMTEVWQTVAYLENPEGLGKVGLGTQNVLWSDSQVFASHSENGGNALMYAIGERALQMIHGQTFADPISLLDSILEEVLAYGKTITKNPNLRKTFALNALVGLDNAAWLLHAAQNGINNFDDMVPGPYQTGLSAKHDKVASIPALGYGTPIEEVKRMADQGFFIMKIKIGAPGTQAEMLEQDKAFLKGIHDAIGAYETPHTRDGKLPYYFDANGRYDSKDTLKRFLDYADEIGALPQIAVVEEPFGERNQESVEDITAYGPRVAADESAHTDIDAATRIEQGYNCIAVKAIAKTLSMTMKIAQLSYDKNVPCFCADLTVNPILVDWNKTVAARLAAFPGLDFGLQETNGWQNYRDWDKMMAYHPKASAEWTKSKNGVYETGTQFFKESGGIFLPSSHYDDLVK